MIMGSMTERAEEGWSAGGKSEDRESFCFSTEVTAVFPVSVCRVEW